MNIDYEDHFYIVIEPYSKSQDNTTINNLLNTTAQIELAMFYLDEYEYEPPEIVTEVKSTSQAVTIFWGIVLITAIYCVLAFLLRRKKRITGFLAGLIMPDVEFKYRQYKIDKRFEEATSQIHLRDAEADPLNKKDYQPKKNIVKAPKMRVH